MKSLQEICALNVLENNTAPQSHYSFVVDIYNKEKKIRYDSMYEPLKNIEKILELSRDEFEAADFFIRSQIKKLKVTNIRDIATGRLIWKSFDRKNKIYYGILDFPKKFIC